MTIRSLLICLSVLALSACGAATTKQAQRPAVFVPPPTAKAPAGLDKVMGKDARTLVALFGPAAQDVREESARKLQFAGSACILDTYLYPPSRGKEPVVTYVSARTNDGRDAEKVSCVNALTRR